MRRRGVLCECPASCFVVVDSTVFRVVGKVTLVCCRVVRLGTMFYLVYFSVIMKREHFLLYKTLQIRKMKPQQNYDSCINTCV